MYLLINMISYLYETKRQPLFKKGGKMGTKTNLLYLFSLTSFIYRFFFYATNINPTTQPFLQPKHCQQIEFYQTDKDHPSFFNVFDFTFT